MTNLNDQNIDIKCCVRDCFSRINCTNSYSAHLGIFHKYDKFCSYLCTYEKCSRTFTQFSSLKRHLKNVHEFPENFKVNIETCSKNINENLTNQISSAQSNSIIDSCHIEAEQFESCENHNDDISENIEKLLFEFLLKLHSKNHLTKTIIAEIFECLKEDLLDKLFHIFNLNINLKESFDKSYENLNSQYKFEKKVEINGFLSKGINEVVCFSSGNVLKKGISTISEIKEKITIMPIEKMFEKIFSLNNVLNDTLENIKKLESQNLICNFVNGAKWKEIRNNYSTDAILIPYDIYQDDFETGNALGSNSGVHKISAYYISFPTFPQHLVSSPNYVFEALLYPAHLNNNNMDNCLEKFVIILKKLEEDGIQLEINGELKTVHFILARIIGDNLALNQILGFNKSFNAQKFCRICKFSKHESQQSCKSMDSNLRTIDDYERDIIKSDPKVTGIRSECVFNKLKNFHCVNNLVCDLMHDFLEGIVKYDLAIYLKHLIDDKSIPQLTIENFNILKQNFPYGTHEIGNLSKPIDDAHLKKCLRMSASETKTFLILLPLMIGHVVPEQNKYWKMIVTLIELLELTLQPEFLESSLRLLEEKIISYHSNYLKLIGGNLRPKHHFITHYIQCIKQNGPMRSMMTFVYETKNKIVKNYANVMDQRINISYSLSYKSAMRFNLFLINHSNGFPPTTTCIKSRECQFSDIEKKEYFSNLTQQELNKLNSSSEKLFFSKQINHKGSKYSIDNFIVDCQMNPTKLLKIRDIIIMPKNYYFVLEEFKIMGYERHFTSYRAGNSLNIFIVFDVDDCKSRPFNLHKISNGNSYFKIKFY